MDSSSKGRSALDERSDGSSPEAQMSAGRGGWTSSPWLRRGPPGIRTPNLRMRSPCRAYDRVRRHDGVRSDVPITCPCSAAEPWGAYGRHSCVSRWVPILVLSLTLASCADSASPGDATPRPSASTDPSSDPTATTSPSGEQYPAFVPRTYAEEDSEVLPLTFPDGTEAELLYPESLALGKLGVAPNIVEINRRRCGSDPIMTPFHPVGLIVEGKPLVSFEGLADSIELWKGAKGYLDHYLVFTFGSWSVAMPC